MARILAGMFFLLALMRAYFDWQIANLNETAFEFLPIGQVWFNFDQDSFRGLQPGVERHLSPVIWENAIDPMLLWPMAGALFFMAVFFAGISVWRIMRS